VSLAYLADERVRLLLRQLGLTYEMLEFAERNHQERGAQELRAKIDKTLRDLDNARIKAAADAAQNGRGGGTTG